MKVNKYLVKTASPSRSGTLLPDHLWQLSELGSLLTKLAVIAKK